MATPTTQYPRALNFYARLVVIGRAKCLLIDYANYSAAQPTSNATWFVLQLQTVLCAATNLKKTQFCFHYFLSVALEIG